MRYHALACDYDGTIAHHGRVDEATLAALQRVKDSGRKLVLVSGRHLEDLRGVFPRLDLFDRAVLENGALIVDPHTHDVRTLGEPPPAAFVETLRRRGVRPLATGRVIVATWEPHQDAVLATIHDLGLELQVVFNKGAVMVLPSGLNKAVGLCRALEEIGLSLHNVVGVGDAENDHAFLDACELSAAVANAIPMLKAHVDLVTSLDHGAGVAELVEMLLEDDLRRFAIGPARHAILLGAADGGAPITIAPYCAPVLIAGTSGAGKSHLATSLIEQLAEREFQFCIIDPEGDYGAMLGVTHLGDAKLAPGLDAIVDILARPGADVVVNLLGLPLADRPAFFVTLFARLLELRARTGRPHWFVLDEAHHLLPRSLDDATLPLPKEPHGLLLLTVHADNISRRLAQAVGTVIVIGSTPRATLDDFAESAGVDAPSVAASALAPGRAIVWMRDRPDAPPIELTTRPPQSEHQRHIRKYAAGDLGPDVSFYFRGPKGALRLRAHNLQMFMLLAEGVDDETWRFHLANGDYSEWFRDNIKDPELADEVEEIEAADDLSPKESRERVRTAIEQRYSAA